MVLLAGADAETVMVEKLTTVTVSWLSWRGMSPATAGPARSAETEMLASILSLLMGMEDLQR